MRHACLAVMLLIALASVGCSTPSEDAPDDNSNAGALVSDSTFTTAYQTLRGIDYLPFQYKENGCFARALYMTMELAATGQESNVVFAFANGGNMLKVGDITWVYHVAPLLWVGTSSESAKWMVVDPSIEAHPLTLVEWITAMGYPAGTPADRAPTYAMMAGSKYDVWASASHFPINYAADVPNFGALPNFKTSNAARACRTMYRFLTLEAAPDMADKKAKLLRRTSEVLKAIETRGKLTRDVEFSTADCASAQPNDVEPQDPPDSH